MPDELTPGDDTAADNDLDLTPITPAKEDKITMTNAELNAKLKSHRLGLQRKLDAAEKRATGFDTMQNQVTDMLQSGIVDGIESEGLDAFRQSVEQTIADHRSEADNLKAEAGKQAKALKSAEDRATTATNKFNMSTINQSITDEAADKAYSAGALNLIRKELRDKATLDDSDVATFLMNVADEEGNVKPTRVSAKQAVEIMEADVTNFGPLFKSAVNSGAGTPVTVDGLKRNASGAIDLSKMTMEQFMEMEDKNPGLIEQSITR
jgi:hypothetical protein